MRNLFILFAVLFMSSSVAYSAPNYDPNHIITTYDVSYNIKLRNKLEADFDKKYSTPWVKTVDEYGNVTISSESNAPMDAYYNEVVKPYHRNKKNLEDCPIVSRTKQ